MKKILFIFLTLFVVLIIITVLILVLERDIAVSEKVALIRVEGPIFDSKDVIDELKGHMKNSSVKAVILRIDSPGGAVAPAQEIYEEIKKSVSKKKIVVSMGSIAASGGYYIAAPASRIVANPGTLTGSIGVIMEIPNIEGLMNKIGVKTEVIKSGEHKDIASIFRGIRKEEREILQNVLENVHEQFIEAVAEGRKIEVEQVKKFADGRIFTGEQALKEGLVDELGNLEDAIKVAARLAGIKGEPVVISKKEKFSLINLLRNSVPKELAEISPTLRVKYMFLP
ncbi:MAG: signal peptide peptidase SppA [Nitrospirota bacterium]